MDGAGELASTARHGCLLALWLLAAATPARALVVHLAQALELARIRSPTLRTAAADLDAARGRQRQAELWPENPVLWVESAAHTVGSAAFYDRGISLEQALEIGGQR